MGTEIKLKSNVWKVNVDKRLHLLMRELTQRKRTSTGYSIADQYEKAVRDYLQTERVPRKLEKIERTSLRFTVTEEFTEMIESLRLIAKKKRQPLPVILEEVLQRYLDKDENYLGKSFYERNKRRIEIVK